MATPFVAGMAALLWEKYPNVTGHAIWKKLIDGARGVDLRSSGDCVCFVIASMGITATFKKST